MSWNTIIKGGDTPVIVRINGVDLPSLPNIIIKLGSETYSKVSNPSVFILDTDDITKLELLLGDTTLDVGAYSLHIKVVDAEHPRGTTLTDCIENVITVKVRDEC